MIHNQSGTPFVGSLSLNTGAPGPLPIPINVVRGVNAPYTLATGERVVITNIVVSSNDTAGPVVTIDDGSATPTVFVKSYAGSAIPALVEAIPFGLALGAFGTNIRATSSAITAAKTVEITIKGFITRT